MNELNPKDLLIDVVGKAVLGFAPLNPKGIKITHIPTGLHAEADTDRSQHRNRELAYQKLKQLVAAYNEADPAREAFEQWRDQALANWKESSEKDAYAFMEGWKAARQTQVTKA